MIEIKDGQVVLTGEDIHDGKWYSKEEFANLHQMQVGTVRQWVKRGHLDTIRIGKQTFVYEKTDIRARAKAGRPRKSL